MTLLLLLDRKLEGGSGIDKIKKSRVERAKAAGDETTVRNIGLETPSDAGGAPGWKHLTPLQIDDLPKNSQFEYYMDMPLDKLKKTNESWQKDVKAKALSKHGLKRAELIKDAFDSRATTPGLSPEIEAYKKEYLKPGPPHIQGEKHAKDGYPWTDAERIKLYRKDLGYYKSYNDPDFNISGDYGPGNSRAETLKRIKGNIKEAEASLKSRKSRF